MTGLLGSEGAKLQRAISGKTQGIVMAEKQTVHVRVNSCKTGDICHCTA